jgi:hypothetical protein
MRLTFAILAILFIVFTTAAVLVSGSEDATPISHDSLAEPLSEQPTFRTAEMPAEPGCTTETESGPGFNRSVVRCQQEAVSPAQSSSERAGVPPASDQTPMEATPPRAAPQAQTEALPPPDAAPQHTTPGDAGPACVTEEESGDGWTRTTVRCNRRSETAGSSTSSSSVVTSSSVSISSSSSSGTP